MNAACGCSGVRSKRVTSMPHRNDAAYRNALREYSNYELTMGTPGSDLNGMEHFDVVSCVDVVH